MGNAFETFQTIPQAPKYEMNRRGDIRNKTTGQLRRWQQRGKSKITTLNADGGKKICVSLSSLLWYLFGESSDSSGMTVPVTISKGNRTLKFDSSKACARFLARKEHYSTSWAVNLLSRRRPVIFGWAVKYLR